MRYRSPRKGSHRRRYLSFVRVIVGIILLAVGPPLYGLPLTNSTPIIIPAVDEVGVGAPYPSLISVSGLSGQISKVTATLHGLTHTSILDVGALLVGPGGQSVVLMDFVGSGEIVDTTYAFDDDAPDHLSFTGVPPSGTYKPTARDFFGDVVSEFNTFDPPAPSSGYSSIGLAIFNGLEPNGLYALYVQDFFDAHTGVLAGGWTLTIITEAVSEPGSLSLVALALVFMAATRRAARRAVFAMCWWVGLTAAVHAQSLAPIPGSPLTVPSPPAGRNSNVAVLNATETRLFVSNQHSNTISVFNVAADGSVSFNGAFATAPSLAATGLALNPSGTRLYVTTYDATLNVHGIAPDGSLPQLQAASLGTISSALAGVVYVSLPGGDVVYVNNNEVPNTVTAFGVLPDGTLSSGVVVATGGNGNPVGFFGAPRLLAGADRRLYVLNEVSSTISVFNIDASTGVLTAVPGSPFSLPGDTESSGPLALTADATTLYAGTRRGDVIKYQINPATGVLSAGEITFTGVVDAINGLALDPSGSFLVAVLFFEQQIAVLNTATMTPVANSPFNQDVLSSNAYGAGILFNAAGNRVVAGDANPTATKASFYSFGP